MSQIKFRAETDLAAALLMHRLPQKPAQKAAAETQCAMPPRHTHCAHAQYEQGVAGAGASSAVSGDISSSGNQTC